MKNIIYASLKMMGLDVHTRFSTRSIKGQKKEKKIIEEFANPEKHWGQVQFITTCI